MSETSGDSGETVTPSTRVAWGGVTLAAVLMLATLPGRTQGLGLITEPLQADLAVDDITYANINLWATLLGSAFCLPAGWLMDRWGLRLTTTIIVAALGATVWAMSAISGGVFVLFAFVLLTRGFGQSALSVASITMANFSARRSGMAIGVYSVLLSVFMAGAFVAVGGIVIEGGWRTAWQQTAMALLLVVAPLSLAFLPGTRGAPLAAVNIPGQGPGMTLREALRTPVFWVFGGSIALFGLVSSGVGLFNEGVLAEQGFLRAEYHQFLANMALVSLLGQFICGRLSRRYSLSRLLGAAMFIYAASLACVPLLQTTAHLSLFASFFGLSAGMISVIFFAVWSHAFGQLQPGRIQGAAQMLSVFASAFGPLLFACAHHWWHSYTPLLLGLAPVTLLAGVIAWFTKIPAPASVPPAAEA